MRIRQITEAPPLFPGSSGQQLELPLPGGSGKAPKLFSVTPVEGGGFAIIDKNNKVYGTINSKIDARMASIKLNRQAGKLGLGTPEFEKAAAQSVKDFKLNTKELDLQKLKAPDKRSPAKKVAQKAGKFGAHVIGMATKTAWGAILFSLIAVEELMSELDGWADAYEKSGCNINDATVRAYTIKIRKVLTGEIIGLGAMVAAGAKAVKTLSNLLMLLGPAGWIARAVAWVAVPVAAYMLGKALANTKFVDGISEWVLGGILEPRVIRAFAFPNCPKESIYLETADADADKLSKSLKVDAKKDARQGLKQLISDDPKMKKIYLATKKKVKAGEV